LIGKKITKLIKELDAEGVKIQGHGREEKYVYDPGA
jgi:hypothetical protein